MSAAPYHDIPLESNSYFHHNEGTPGLYDGSTSSDSSASSPLNTQSYDQMYGNAYTQYPQYPAFPYQYPMEDLVPARLIPVELDIEGLYEDHDRRRKRQLNGNEKPVSPHVHSRRRAQNRASQRAFRDRKEKHMRELELKLNELQGRHDDLTRSYESLQSEYSNVKTELDRLRKDNTHEEPSSSQEESQIDNVWDSSRDEMLDPMLFDVSAFCYDQDDDDQHKI
ncbi:bZIP transcription factor [Phlyctema vagabunda]|uniref:Putative transcription factor kapC n=1 Tax=Phlyctema vagabunda TaxID=108571 RepID=A0ABR4PGM6_9HELO